MKLKPKKKIKIDNYKAQYNSILGNISSANKTLEGILIKVVNSQKEFTTLMSSLKEGRKELKKVTKLYYDTDSAVNHKERLIEKRELGLEKKETKAKEQEAKSLKKIADKENKSESKLKKLEDKVVDKEMELVYLNTEVEEVKNKLDIILPQIVSKTSELRNIESMFTKTEKDMSEFMITSQKKVDVKIKELEKIEEKITEEKSKIELPMLSLKEAELKLKRQEKNLNTLITRFNRVFKVKFPEQELII